MPKIIILRGPYCSGKTTWALNYCAKHKNTIRLSKKDIYNVIRPSHSSDGLLTVINKMFVAGLAELMHKRKTIIIDDPHMLTGSIKSTIDTVNSVCLKNMDSFIENEINYSIYIKDFKNTPLSVCLDRNKKSLNPKSESAITKCYNRFHEVIWNNCNT